MPKLLDSDRHTTTELPVTFRNFSHQSPSSKSFHAAPPLIDDVEAPAIKFIRSSPSPGWSCNSLAEITTEKQRSQRSQHLSVYISFPFSVQYTIFRRKGRRWAIMVQRMAVRGFTLTCPIQYSCAKSSFPFRFTGFHFTGFQF